MIKNGFSIINWKDKLNNFFQKKNNCQFQMINNSYLNNSSLNKMHTVSSVNLNSKLNQHSKENQNVSFQSLSKSKPLGLNPNLNIEDEYVENMLKQIHFMNMEIKLLKEKQSQSQNNALWGIINRTKEPLIKNIVESSEKYQSMKVNMDTQQQQLSADNIRLADLQNAILKQYEYLQSKIASVRKKKQTFDTTCKEKQGKNNIKILEYTAKLKIIADQKQLEKKRNLTFANQYDALITQGEKEQSKNQYEIAKIRQDQIIEEQMEKQKIAAISTIKHKINILKEKFLANEDYQKAQEQQLHLRQKVAGLQKDISGANFQLIQLTESIKLAEIQTQKQIKERKKLTEEYEASKTMFLEISLLNLGRKQKETDNRKRQSVEIQKAQYQTKKLQKNLEQIKRKLAKCGDTENQLRIQVEALERQLDRLKTKSTQLRTQLAAVSAKNEEQDRSLMSAQSEIRKLQDQHQKVSNEDYMLTCELESVQEEIQYLRGRKDFLNEALNLKDTLNETRLQDLQRVVQKNIDLNETVRMLMGKWEEIKEFSRM